VCCRILIPKYKIEFLMLKLLFICASLGMSFECYSQGYNHQWLLGSFNFLQDPKGRMLIDSNNFSLISEFRKMSFKGTQGNISDNNGNLLMASNGIWIANATGDTMLNGNGINPGGITNDWPFGLPLTANFVFLPFPGDTTKFVAFHHSATFNGQYSPCYELYYSVIDLTLDNGLGAVTIKNQVVIQDTLNYGIGVCKHANGRDWWIVMAKDSSDVIFKVLFTSSGITNVTTQSLGYTPLPWGNVAQLSFSPDGNKFATTTYFPESNLPMDSSNSSVVLFNFDRCSGMFSNPAIVSIIDNQYLFGLAFSPSGQYTYTCSSGNIFQINNDTYNVDTVATYDGYISPGPSCCPAAFWNMYTAANGKIYISSGSGVQHIHEMNYPDSAGIACDVQQHAIDLIDYLYLRAVPNHPNYYLGCDTTSGCACLTTSIEDQTVHDFKFSISPNPTNGQLKLIYLLPQNEDGKFEIFDTNGKMVFFMILPKWSTLQQIDLSTKLFSGIYNCVLTSNDERTTKKIIVLND
jgi:hypothetical protein